MANAFHLILLVLTIATALAGSVSAHYERPAPTGPWGTNGAQASGSYVYDALGNIRTRNDGTAGTAAIAYDATNRASSMTIGGSTRAFAYDARGNVASNGQTGFTYDFANQPITLTGTGAASFSYDANLKRVKEVRCGKPIYTVYSRLTGGLVYRFEDPIYTANDVRTDYASAGITVTVHLIAASVRKGLVSRALSFPAFLIT